MTTILLLAACQSEPSNSHTGAVPDTGPVTLDFVVSDTDAERIGFYGGSPGAGPFDPDQTVLMDSLLERACEPGAECHPMGIQADGDGWVFAWAEDRPSRGLPGGVARMVPGDGGWVLDWELRSLDGEISPGTVCDSALGEDACGLSYPHAAIPDPQGRGVIVADTFHKRLLWVEPEGSGAGKVLAVLDESNPDWRVFDGPNGLQAISHDGRDLLLVSYKNSSRGDTEPVASGHIVLWDVTDLEHITLQWLFPEEGALSSPHGPVLVQRDGGWMLTWGHSRGLSTGSEQSDVGSVGVAALEAPDRQPVYLADLVLDGEALGYPREAEPVLGLRYLLVTDSMCETVNRGCDSPGKVLLVPLPELEPTGLGGAWLEDHSDQEVVQVTGWSTLAEALTVPFEADPYSP